MKLLKILTAFATLVALQIASAQWLHVPPPVEARMTAVVVGGGVPAESGGCSTPTTSSELNEGFLGSGYENTWSETGTGTIDENYSLPGSPPESSCTEGLQISKSETGILYTRWDRGSAIDISANVVDLTFSIYIDSAVMDSYAYGTLMVLSSGSDPSTGNLLSLKLRCNSASQCSSSSLQFSLNTVSGTRVALTVDTWYEIKIHINASGTSYFQVTGGGNTTCDTTDECTFTITDVDPRYLSITAMDDFGAGESITYAIGDIHIDIP